MDLNLKMEPTQLVSVNNSSEENLENSLQATPNYVYISNDFKNCGKLDKKTFPLNTGSPMLMLSNITGGSMEANVLVENTITSPYIKLELHSSAHANLIAQTQDMLAQQLSQDSLNIEKKTYKKKGCKVYRCKVQGCDKLFSSSNYLSLHEASHTACKSLICDYCGRKFLWSAHLSYHRLTHTNDRQHICEFNGCNKKFYTSQRLKIHSLTHTGEKPYQCTESGCIKSFTTAGNLRNHIRTHTGERPFVCDYEGCSRRFAECSSLKKHKIVHSGQKPYTCDICGKSFSQSGTRTVHMRSHKLSTNHHVLKVAEIKFEINSARVLDSQSPEILLLQQSTDDTAHYHGLTDHIVTITTHQPDTEQSLNEVPHHILGAEEVLGGGEIPTHQLCDKGVVVLTEPQEIVHLSSSYHPHEAIHEEIVYDNDLLNSHLDHEEIHGASSSLCLEQSSGELNVSELTSRSVSVSQQSLSSETGSKEMQMDPMMESDDEADSETK